MNRADPNLPLLESVARELGPLCDRFVFVGGCATGLLVTDPAASPVRTTLDVDVVVEVVSLAGYHALERELQVAAKRRQVLIETATAVAGAHAKLHGPFQIVTASGRICTAVFPATWAFDNHLVHVFTHWRVQKRKSPRQESLPGAFGVRRTELGRSASGVVRYPQSRRLASKR